jgi:hypothetical protein
MTPGLQELATMMEGGSQKQWGNRLGYLIFPISVKHFSDPLDHVRAAKRTSDRMKASLEGAFTYWSGALLMAMTGPPVQPPSINVFCFSLWGSMDFYAVIVSACKSNLVSVDDLVICVIWSSSDFLFI